MDNIQKEMLLNLSEQVSVLNEHIKVIDQQIECLVKITDSQFSMMESLNDALMGLARATLLINEKTEKTEGSSVPKEKHTCGTCKFEYAAAFENPCCGCKYGNGLVDCWAPKEED